MHAVFKSSNKYDLHMVVGNHTNTCQGTETVYDKTKCNWAKMFTRLSLTTRNPRHQEKGISGTTSLMEENVCGAKFTVLPIGWALKQSNVTSYFETRYLADPVQVVADMQTARNENGDRLFLRNECLNATLILKNYHETKKLK